jgi:AbrB family looped-hinge helix DNA binding protein
MEDIVISAKGKIRIPADLRAKYGMKPGTKVHFVADGKALILIPIRQKRAIPKKTKPH